MRAGDIVRGDASARNETLVVAWVDGDRFGWCGWPDGQTYTRYFEVVQAADDELHEATLRECAEHGGGFRARMAWRNLAELLERQDRFVRIAPVTSTRFVAAGGTR